MPRIRRTNPPTTTTLWKMVVTGILTAMAMASKTAVVAFRPAVGLVRTTTSLRSIVTANNNGVLLRKNKNNNSHVAACESAASSALLRRSAAAVLRGSSSSSSSRLFASVTGNVYEADDDSSRVVVVTLYTKEGCTLCDKVKDVLKEVHQESDNNSKQKHSLRQIDITDENQKDSYDRYKYDIPVLHIGYSDSDGDSDSAYWTKHRLTKEEAKEAITEAMTGSFEPRQGRPNASAMER